MTISNRLKKKPLRQSKVKILLAIAQDLQKMMVIPHLESYLSGETESLLLPILTSISLRALEVQVPRIDHVIIII
jgi:hypothetical protein